MKIWGVWGYLRRRGNPAQCKRKKSPFGEFSVGQELSLDLQNEKTLFDYPV